MKDLSYEWFGLTARKLSQDQCAGLDSTISIERWTILSSKKDTKKMCTNIPSEPSIHCQIGKIGGSVKVRTWIHKNQVLKQATGEGEHCGWRRLCCITAKAPSSNYRLIGVIQM